VVLVDTSVWIEFLDRDPSPLGAELETLLRRGEVATAGLVLAELRQGCRSSQQVKLLMHVMQPLPYLEADRSAWLQAGELASECAARGYTLKIADCLLASLALREGCSLFTLDGDFQQIPRLRLYPAPA